MFRLNTETDVATEPFNLTIFSKVGDLKSIGIPAQRHVELELCADVIVSAAAARVGGQKMFFQRFPKKFRSILKIF